MKFIEETIQEYEERMKRQGNAGDPAPETKIDEGLSDFGFLLEEKRRNFLKQLQTQEEKQGEDDLRKQMHEHD